jgi:hypothetical protein
MDNVFKKKYPFRSTNLEPWNFEPEFLKKKPSSLGRLLKSMNAELIIITRKPDHFSRVI